jgi:hypothetical protein
MDKKNMQQQFEDQGCAPNLVEKKHGVSPESVEKNKNGSMAQDLGEMKKLGKEMSKMKTGTQQLEEDNLISDPLQ